MNEANQTGGAKAPPSRRFRSTKTFGHDLGLSAAFRQWRADSHCKYLHGYALAFTLTFEADDLDNRNWVMDFGGLKEVKDLITAIFDHKTLVAIDDPELTRFEALADAKVIDLVVVQATGCEAFAAQVYRMTQMWLNRAGHAPRVRLVSVECREHGANSAIFMGQVV
jgi:6-pyruvoyltetrahydropterin/6-carboxytetrahydropterin synthase